MNSKESFKEKHGKINTQIVFQKEFQHGIEYESLFSFSIHATDWLRRRGCWDHCGTKDRAGPCTLRAYSPRALAWAIFYFKWFLGPTLTVTGFFPWFPTVKGICSTDHTFSVPLSAVILYFMYCFYETLCTEVMIVRYLNLKNIFMLWLLCNQILFKNFVISGVVKSIGKKVERWLPGTVGEGDGKCV